MNRPTGLVTDNLNEQSIERFNAIRGILSTTSQNSNAGSFKELPISKLNEFHNHPFKVRDDEEMEALADSIKRQGVIYPIIVRIDPIDPDKYEILTGHRRVFAAKKLGLYEITAKVVDVDDDTAILIMTDTNLRQRERLLYSEKAKAYRMQLEALKNLEGKDFDAAEKVAEENSENRRNIFFYVKLNNLVPELLDMTDAGQLFFRAAVALSELSVAEQNCIIQLYASGKLVKMSVAQALLLKKNKGNLTEDIILALIGPTEKAQSPWQPISAASQRATKYFKKNSEALAGIEWDEDELGEVMIEAIQAYMNKKTPVTITEYGENLNS